jgi:RimJ/RimL family protein N-acetyltransferase
MVGALGRIYCHQRADDHGGRGSQHPYRPHSSEDERRYGFAVELLRTPRLVLRNWDEADLAAYFDIYSRWEVVRWLGSHPRRALTDLDQARTGLARWQAMQAAVSAPYGLWAIVPQPGDQRQPGPVGTVLLLSLHDDAGPTTEVEVGWHLHPGYQGRGYATEAAAALLGAAAQAGLAAVLALTDPDNLASQAVAGRLGMADEGLTHRWYGITAHQYRWTARSLVPEPPPGGSDW